MHPAFMRTGIFQTKTLILDKPSVLTLTFKPYQLIFLVSFILFAVSFLLGKRTWDLHIQDTYFVIANFNMYLLFAVFLLVIGMIYVIAHTVLYSRTLGTVHIILTIAVLLLLLGTIYLHSQLLTGPIKGRIEIGKLQLQERVIVISILILSLAQILFFINIFAGIIRRSRM